jgi:hypothetical protein
MRAGNGHPKTRSTKVPTKSGHGFSIKTINKDVLSGDKFSRASGDKARTTSLTMRRRERPSGHARLEQQQGEEDCAGVVCWQKPQGHTGISRRRCRFLPGGAWTTGGSALARRPTGRSQRHPASMALSDELYREESNKCKEAGGAQDNLSNEEDNNKDIGEDKDDDRDNKASNAELVAVAAEEQTQRQCNVQWRIASGISIGQTPGRLGQ